MTEDNNDEQPPTRRGMMNARQSAFLEKLVEMGSVSAAAEAANVGRQTVYDWLHKDPDFKNRYMQSFYAGGDRVEDEAVERALNGVVKPVFYKGKQIAQVREYPDRLLIALLKGRLKKKYAAIAAYKEPLYQGSALDMTPGEIREISRKLEEEC